MRPGTDPGDLDHADPCSGPEPCPSRTFSSGPGVVSSCPSLMGGILSAAWRTTTVVWISVTLVTGIHTAVRAPLGPARLGSAQT